ncbi:MAG: hypothetical protein WCH34_05025 [Bacteroidota bacterium]
MAKLLWIFLRNIFGTITKRNNRKMDSISADHDRKLAARASNPIIAVIYATFHPLRLSFHASYSAYIAALGEVQGITLAIKNLWKEASSTLYDDWETAVKLYYKKGSDKHKSLFPNGHEPFRTGTYEQRITAIEALSLNMEGDPDLADAKDLVDDFLSRYSDKRAAHDDKDLLIKNLLSEVKTKKEALSLALYSDLGYLMYKYPGQPDVIGSYFNISEIVSSTSKDDGGESNELTLTIQKSKIIEGGFAFLPTTKIRVYNSGTTDLALFTAAAKANPTVPEEPFTLHPEEDTELEMSILGLQSNRFFFIANLSATDDGEIVIDEIN